MLETAKLYMDSYKIIKLLEERGFEKMQAEGVLEAIQEINLLGVATKADISGVREEIADFKAEVAEFKAEVKTDNLALREEIKNSAANTRTWVLGFLLIQLVGIISLIVTLMQKAA